MQKAAVPIIAVEEEDEMSRGNPLDVLIQRDDVKSRFSALLLFLHLITQTDDKQM